MATTFKLDPKLSERIAKLETDLRTAAQELRDMYDEKSERWQEGDTGAATDTWIESLDNLADELDAITDKPE